MPFDRLRTNSKGLSRIGAAWMPWINDLMLLVASGYLRGSLPNAATVAGGMDLVGSAVRPLLLRLGFLHITQTCTSLTRLPPCISRISWHSMQPTGLRVPVVLSYPVLTTFRRVLSPVTPFTTETAWRATLSVPTVWVKYPWRGTARICAPTGYFAVVSLTVYSAGVPVAGRPTPAVDMMLTEGGCPAPLPLLGSTVPGLFRLL